jgi:hypothetical protein
MEDGRMSPLERCIERAADERASKDGPSPRGHDNDVVGGGH